ncbi:MAG: hypothetical protein R2695_03885 [Acidimicrobiales bacterium]
MPPKWVAHEGGPDCHCADGSDYWFHSRTDDPTKVVLYFQGGGACFSEETCQFDDTGTYKVTTGPDDRPGGDGGPRRASSTSPTPRTRSPAGRSCSSRIAPATSTSAPAPRPTASSPSSTTGGPTPTSPSSSSPTPFPMPSSSW